MSGDVAGPLAAFGLGVMTALQPCPLLTHLSGLAVLLGAAPGGRRALAAGTGLAVGFACAYATLGALLAGGAVSLPGAANALQRAAPRWGGPLLVLAGMALADLLILRPGATTGGGANRVLRAQGPQVGAAPGSGGRSGCGFLVGLALALAFCPASAALFFGLLVPLAIAQGAPLLYPALYGLGVALPFLAVVGAVYGGAGAAARAGWAGGRTHRRLARVAGAILIGAGIWLTALS